MYKFVLEIRDNNKLKTKNNRTKTIKLNQKPNNYESKFNRSSEISKI